MFNAHELMFAVREHMFIDRELMFTAREHRKLFE
jgi:hypothetical protein